MRRPAAALLALVAFAVGAASGPGVARAGYQDAAAAYGRGDYATARHEWRRLAERGDAEAQFSLGVMYRKGQGVRRDAAEAARWFRRAAEQGAAAAQNHLGFMYVSGEGVTRDSGEGMWWIRKAAGQGYAAAQYNLGLLYGSGRGAPRDDVQAYLWLDLAAEHGSKPARTSRDMVARRMTPAQRAEARGLVRAWRQDRALRGDGR